MRFLKIVIFLAVVTMEMPIISFGRNNTQIASMYKEWLLKHKKGNGYGVEGEKERRFEIFKENLRYIDEHNAKNLSYRLGLNQFSNLTPKELSEKHLYNVEKRPSSFPYKTRNRYVVHDNEVEADLPVSIDWRQLSAVTPVKNEMGCGACWAFAVVATVESVNYIETKQLIRLSEQQLVDCDTNSRNCKGAADWSAFNYVLNHGLHTEDYYPYVNRKDKCKLKDNPKKAFRINVDYDNFDGTVEIDDWEAPIKNNEYQLKKAVARQPVAVAIEGGLNFDQYETGIYKGPCGTETNHALAVVGYGSENNQDYWILKNSYGLDWGERGYMKMARNVNGETGPGLCGITSDPAYPIKYKI